MNNYLAIVGGISLAITAAIAVIWIVCASIDMVNYIVHDETEQGE